MGRHQHDLAHWPAAGPFNAAQQLGLAWQATAVESLPAQLFPPVALH
jgi:hypothetical protein